MPDHAGDRGAVRLDLGASRSPAYQPDEDGHAADLSYSPQKSRPNADRPIT
jgi:hypothetical protein